MAGHRQSHSTTGTLARPLAAAGPPRYRDAVPQLSFRTSLLDALTLTEEDGAIVALDWGWARDQATTPLLEAARTQIEEYLDGERRSFDLPLRPCGTPYRLKVWAELAKIPFGETLTYAQLATRAGGVARSIGGAMGSNPIPIIIPCHRVLAVAGLGGFSGGDGLETKRRLLHLEHRMAGQAAVPF